ncbi:MAG: hypothetical protein AB9M60_22865 [Leptothrix sp. (in: b-proteobacteria)]
MADPTDLPSVPAHCQGLWRRTLLAVPSAARDGSGDGLRDTTTCVHWLQTPLWHGDLRVPANRPDFSGIHALADCSDAQLRWLLTQQGFAGVTRVGDEVVQGVPRSVCRWQRRIDLAESEVPDIGWLGLDATGLDEWGVEADYHERWVATEGASADAKHGALGLGWSHAQPANDTGARTVCLRVGDWAMHLRSRTLDAATTRQARRAAAEDLPMDRATLIAAADFEISLARWTPGGVGGFGAGWRIAHSSWPWREGAWLHPDDPTAWAAAGASALPGTAAGLKE